MDFTYSEEQRMLAESLQRLLDDQWRFADRRARRAAAGFDEAPWRALAELGVLGLCVPAEAGGFGEPPASLVPVHLALGRALVDEPVIPAVMVAAALQACADAAREGQAGAGQPGAGQPGAGQPGAVQTGAGQPDVGLAHDLLASLAAGGQVLTRAYQEPGRRYAVPADQCRAREADGAWQVSGVKHLVWHGAAAHGWILNAVTQAGEQVLLHVSREASGADIVDTPTLDGTRCARLTLQDAPATLLAHGSAAERAIERGLQWGTAALCAHAAGAMARLLELTADYLRTRRQFGQPLAAFQALQHRVADMLVNREMALAMAHVAAAALAEPDTRERARMLAHAKLQVGRHARQLGQAAVQLHGGMGMTDELEVGDYFKRLTAVDLLLGDTATQLATLQTLAADADEETPS